MNDNNLSDIGKRISSLVQDAVNTMDFDKLNENISSTVNSALDEVQKRLMESKNHKTPNRNELHKNRQQRSRPSRNQPIYSEAAGNETKPVPINRSPAGRVSGILCIVFGSIGTGLMLLLYLAYAITNAVSGGALSSFASITLSAFLPALLISFSLQMKGISLRRRLKRFRWYERKINGRSLCTIKELTFGSGYSEKRVVRDLKRMIRKGMFKEGHIDDQNTCIMLTYDVYRQYIQYRNSMSQHKPEEIESHGGRHNTKTTEPVVDEHVKQVIAEGMGYIDQIQEANNRIPDAHVSGKLFRLETVVQKIFDHIEGHPEQVSEIRQFMEYYLPTTLKLVNTYKELDKQAIQKGNIISAKSEIEKTLDTINLAFENLHDSLFEDVAMDITTDISVLETMLKREGLTENDFV